MDHGPIGPAVWSISTPGEYTIRLTHCFSGFALDALVFQLVSLPAPTGDGPDESERNDEKAFLETAGRVAVEAEHFSLRRQGVGNDRRWRLIPSEEPGIAPWTSFRGSGYVQFMPDIGGRKRRISPSAFTYRVSTSARSQAVQSVSRNEPRRDDWYGVRAQTSHASYQFAMMSLLLDEPQKYRDICGQMLEHFAETDDVNDARWTAWTCVLMPNAVDNYDACVRFAEIAVSSDSNNSQSLGTLGDVLFRAGRHEDAVETSHRDHRHPGGDTLPKSTSPALYLVLPGHVRAETWPHRRSSEMAGQSSATKPNKNSPPTKHPGIDE